MEVVDKSLLLDGDSVSWRIFKPAGSTKDWCVLWLQGWTSSMESNTEGMLRLAESSKTPFAILDYAGHGEHRTTIEKSTKEQQLNEVLGVYDELEKLGYKKIIAIGGSFGAYMAALLSGKRPVHAVVLRAPASYPDFEFTKPFEQTEGYTDPVAHRHNKAKPEYLNNQAVASIRNFDGFVYVLEHEFDKIIDVKIPRIYFKAAKHGNYLIIPKTPHSAKELPHPEKHYAYTEHIIRSIIGAIKLAESLG